MTFEEVRHSRVLAIVGEFLQVRGSNDGFGDFAIVEIWDGCRSLGMMRLELGATQAFGQHEALLIAICRQVISVH